MQTFNFSIRIGASPAVIWETMLSSDTFREWTAAFMEGSFYEGSWEEGARIRFLTPQGDGMVSEIAENRLHRYISIRHLGVVNKGVEDVESDDVKAWAPAYENYRLTEIDDGTLLEVEVDVEPQNAEMLSQTWPQALALLKELCETPAVATPS